MRLKTANQSGLFQLSINQCATLKFVYDIKDEWSEILGKANHSVGTNISAT